MEGGHEGGSSREPLLLRAHSNKVRWKQPAAVLGAELHEGVSDGELLSAEQRELRGAEQLEQQAQLASLAEAQELQPILSSFSAPLLASVPGMPLALVASEAPRRPNPWELSNKKTFKPIITIGKTGGGAPPLAAKRRQLFSLPFAQQRRMPSLPPARRVSTTPPLCAAEGLPSLRCGTLCLGAAIDVKEVYTHYSRQGLACTAYKDGLNVVVHCQHRADDKPGDAHAFYFMHGSIVLWNFSAASEGALVAETRRLFAREAYAEPEIDDFAYVQLPAGDGSRPHIHKDVIHLSSDSVMEKLAVSFGLGQSAKLSVFEQTTESTIADTRHIPEQLAATGNISLSRNEISRRAGQLFVDRSQVNLHSDMLDTPAFFWEEAEWEPLYQRTAKYMEIEKRVSVLNHRLDIIANLFDMLASEMHEKHSSNLEIIVIVLIVIEGLFQVLTLLQNFSLSSD